MFVPMWLAEEHEAAAKRWTDRAKRERQKGRHDRAKAYEKNAERRLAQADAVRRALQEFQK